jgi:3-hydroxyacyl-[acyl-carrier-protein] dehydratase
LPPPILIDLDKIDLAKVSVGKEQIYQLNPQRYEMAQVDGIFTYDLAEGFIVGYKDVKADEFWVRGHVPDNPVLPGILMIEATAQLCIYLYKLTVPQIKDRFIAFGGLDQVRFRGIVRPGQRLILIGKRVQMNLRISKCQVQAVVGRDVVFEGVILGIPVK